MPARYAPRSARSMRTVGQTHRGCYHSHSFGLFPLVLAYRRLLSSREQSLRPPDSLSENRSSEPPRQLGFCLRTDCPEFDLTGPGPSRAALSTGVPSAGVPLATKIFGSSYV